MCGNEEGLILKGGAVGHEHTLVVFAEHCQSFYVDMFYFKGKNKTKLSLRCNIVAIPHLAAKERALLSLLHRLYIYIILLRDMVNVK